MENLINRLGGDVLYQMNNNSHSQMMGYVLKNDNTVIVIDGGTEQDAAALENLLLSLGGRVDAWFITHAHCDHVMALATVLRRKKIEIGTLYYNFPNLQLLHDYEIKERRFGCADAFFDSVRESGVRTVYAQKGMQLCVDTFIVSVLTNGSHSAKNINDTSVVYRVQTRGDAILFLGDLGECEESLLLADYPEEIRCPIVQMAHHGQDGVSEMFYDYIRPEVCLWPTPDWLWSNCDGTGPHKTLLTRAWMEKYKPSHICSFYEMAELR